LNDYGGQHHKAAQYETDNDVVKVMNGFGMERSVEREVEYG
jgi:hypothetical protein